MQKVTIDYLDNPDLQMALMNKEPGEDCEITLKLKTINAGEEIYEATVESIVYEYEGEDMEIEPTIEEPVGINMFTEMDDEDMEEPIVDMEVDIDMEEPEIDEDIAAIMAE